jgi:hypothetical protein
MSKQSYIKDNGIAHIRLVFSKSHFIGVVAPNSALFQMPRRNCYNSIGNKTHSHIFADKQLKCDEKYRKHLF